MDRPPLSCVAPRAPAACMLGLLALAVNCRRTAAQCPVIDGAACLTYDPSIHASFAQPTPLAGVERALSRATGALLASWVALAGALALLAPNTEAQREHPVHRIGILHEGWAPNHPAVLGLKAGLKELGLEEGRDVMLDIRFT